MWSNRGQTIIQALRETRDSFVGILSAVRAGENSDLRAKNSIPNKVREAMDNRSPDISIYSLVNERSLGKSVKDLRNFRMELGAETTLLSFVPKLRFSHVKFRGATYLDIEAQRSSRSSRAFTSGHGL